MAKKPKAGGDAESGDNLEERRDVHDDIGHVNRDPNHTEELFRVCSTGEGQIVNGHRLDKGTVIELTAEEIKTQRDGGVALDDVHAEDNREVYSVREPYKVPDSSE